MNSKTRNSIMIALAALIAFSLIVIIVCAFILISSSKSYPGFKTDLSVENETETYDENISAPVSQEITTDYYPETTEQLPQELSHSFLTAALSNQMLEFSDFYKISIGEATNALVNNYKVNCIRLSNDQEPAIKAFGEDTINTYKDSLDLSNVYFFEISGDLMLNPDVPYYTEHQSVLFCLMAFDENGNFIDDWTSINVSEDFQTSALIYMSKQNSYY